MEDFKQRSDVTRCTFFEKITTKHRERTGRAKVEVRKQPYQVVSDYNPKCKRNIHEFILI